MEKLFSLTPVLFPAGCRRAKRGPEKKGWVSFTSRVEMWKVNLESFWSLDIGNPLEAIIRPLIIIFIYLEERDPWFN